MFYHLLKNRAISFPLKPYTPLHAYRFASWAIQRLLGSDSHTNIGNKTLALDQKHILNVLMKEQKKKKEKRKETIFSRIGLIIALFSIPYVKWNPGGIRYNTGKYITRGESALLV